MGPFAYGWKCLAIVVLVCGFWAYGVHHGKMIVQSEWDAQRIKTAEATTEYFNKLNDEIVKAHAETEAIRANYIEFKAGKERETTELERAVAAGAKRLSVRASCPATSVQQAGTPASGTAGGTAILDADAGQDYYAYRRAYTAQFATLKLCRDELIKRSAK